MSTDNSCDPRNYPELVAFAEKLGHAPEDIKSVEFFVDPPDSFIDKHSNWQHMPVVRPPYATVIFRDGTKHLMEGPISYVPRKEEEQASDPRNTQFAGWAKAVLDKLVHTPNIDIDPLYDFKLEEWQQILSHAGYALVQHTVESLEGCDLYGVPLKGIMLTIPDMPEEEV